MNEELVPLLSRRFIARRDVKAVQRPNGEYIVDKDYQTDETRPWRGRDLLDHLEGKHTYGHYLLNVDDQCKLFAFDIDLVKPDPMHDFRCYWPEFPADVAQIDTNKVTLHEFNPREAWLDRKHPSRTWLKYQMRMLAGMLARTVYSTLGLECAVAYTGAKGIHVYGFTGLTPAAIAREGALLALEELGCFEASKGRNFFKHSNSDPVDGYPNFTIEVFPKQDSLNDKDLGNLMRLPLGRNLKSTDPTFFVDLTQPMGQLIPHRDPVRVLTTGNPWLDSAHE